MQEIKVLKKANFNCWISYAKLIQTGVHINQLKQKKQNFSFMEIGQNYSK